MIVLKGVTKRFRLGRSHKYVARDVNCVFPARTSVALLGRNGAGKSTLLKIIGGTMLPDRGKVLSTGRISWQIGFAGSFHPDLTGAQNTRFIARIYGVDTRSLARSVQEFAELGEAFHAPFRNYSSGMKARFAFGVSMGIPFSYYLIDEVTSVGDASFKAKCASVLAERLSDAGAIVVSHSESTLRSLCTSGAVLENGTLTWHDDIEDAIAHHGRNMAASISRALGEAANDVASSENDQATPKLRDNKMMRPVTGAVAAAGPTPTDVYLAGRREIDAGNLDTGIAQVAEALRARPEMDGWWAGLAVAHLRAGDLASADESFAKAIRLAPDKVRYLMGHAGVLAQLDRHADAAAAYRRALEIDELSIPAWLGLGRVEAEAGNISAAARAFETVLALDPSHVQGRRALAALGSVSDASASGDAPPAS